jgi:glycosyltransferase involved in cell wall biosynthesis
LQPRKRIHDAIRAFASFRSRHCPGATLDIAGSSYQAGYGEELAQLAASLGVTDAVRMLGPVKDVLERMRSASALLQLAESEVQPWVVVEAMASGLPIVASRIAAHEELVRDGESALIVPVGDPEAACEALRRLHAEPALADQLTANGERRVRQEFDARQMAERVSQVYETLMGQRRPKALASAVGAGHS